MKLCKQYIEKLNCPNNEDCPNDHIDIKTLVKTEIEAQLYGHQWPLSSFGPFSQKPSLPHYIEDQSFEEMRMMYYNSDLSFFETRKKCSEKLKNAEKQMKALMSLDHQVLQNIVDVYEQSEQLSEDSVQCESQLKQSQILPPNFCVYTASNPEEKQTLQSFNNSKKENGSGNVNSQQQETQVKRSSVFNMPIFTPATQSGSAPSIFGTGKPLVEQSESIPASQPISDTAIFGFGKPTTPTKNVSIFNIPQQEKGLSVVGDVTHAVDPARSFVVTQKQMDAKHFATPQLVRQQEKCFSVLKTQPAHSIFGIGKPAVEQTQNVIVSQEQGIKTFGLPCYKQPSIFSTAVSQQKEAQAKSPVIQKEQQLWPVIVSQEQGIKTFGLPCYKQPSIFSTAVSQQKEAQAKSPVIQKEQQLWPAFNTPLTQPKLAPSIFGVGQPVDYGVKFGISPEQPFGFGILKPAVEQTGSIGLYGIKNPSHGNGEFGFFRSSSENVSTFGPKDNKNDEGLSLSGLGKNIKDQEKVVGTKQPTSIFGLHSPAKQHAHNIGLFGPKQLQQPDFSTRPKHVAKLPEFRFGFLPPQKENNVGFFGSPIKQSKKNNNKSSTSAGTCDNCQEYLKDVNAKIDTLSRVFNANKSFLMPQEQEVMFLIESLKQSVTDKLDCVNALKTPPHKLPGLVITPKKKQTSERTKAEIQCKINPFDVTAQIESVTKSFGGSLIIKCNDVDSVEKLQTEVKAKCGEIYNVEILKNSKRPEIIVKGIDNQIDDGQLIEIIKKQNKLVGEMELIKCLGKANKQSRYNAVIEVDGDLYIKLVQENLSHFYIGWNKCHVSWENHNNKKYPHSTDQLESGNSIKANIQMKLNLGDRRNTDNSNCKAYSKRL